MGRLLDRQAEMQRRPFGTNTALSDGTQYGAGGAAGSQFRRQEQAYGRALRLLNRRARRGDVNSALAAIRVGQGAMDDGYDVGGIRNKAQADAGIMGRVEDMNRRGTDLRAADAVKRRVGMEQITDEAPDKKLRVEGNTTSAGTPKVALVGSPSIAPVETPGIDSMREPGTEGMSFDEIEREKRRRLALGGSFGINARDSLDRPSGLLDRAERRRKQFANYV